MGNWRKNYSTEHLDSADIPDGAKVHVKISSVGSTVIEGDKGKESKMLIGFQPSPAFAKVCQKRTWIAAKTCGYCLAAMFGPDTDGWIGKRVTLHVEAVEAFGDTVDAVRVYGSHDIDREVKIRVRKGKGKVTVTMTPIAAAKPGAGNTDPSDRHPDDVRAGVEVPA